MSYLLVFHGSHDPRSQVAADALTQRVREKLQSPPRLRVSPSPCPSPARPSSSRALAPHLAAPDHSVLSSHHQNFVQSAFLECHPLPLHQQIEQFALQIQAAIVTPPCQLIVLPVFLLQGVHVMEDIPAEVALAQQALGHGVKIEVAPHLGSHPELDRLIAKQMASVSVEAWILLAHGSRRSGANQPIAALAEVLGVVPAYWSVSPGLQVRIQELSHHFRKIGIVPFFLFNGGTMDAIAQTLTNFSQASPNLTLMLTNPLEASPELADLLVDLAQGN
ncbi:MAG: sirohydrochlorin chelatase [Leptolyngbyaceae cyanobacterium RU_5_1]|nr:sirohydrochlorin chelatase [Leptolyngbyaceae cyanobacterium RU_5_1]